MTEYIEIVGVNHQEHGQEFLDNLTEGMLITLEREPWNHINPDAIAAKVITPTEIKKVGYVTDSDIDYVAPLLTHRDSVIFRYTGEKRERSFTLDLEQAIVLKKFEVKGKDSVFKGKSPLPYSRTPIILKDEEKAFHLVKQIERDTDLLFDRMPDDEVAKALCDEIDILLKEYYTLAKCSLSKECFECIGFVIHRFSRLLAIPTYNEKFGMTIKNIIDIKTEYINHVSLDEVFKAQMESMTKQMESKNLFEDLSDTLFENKDNPTIDEIKDLVLEIKSWLKLIPGKASNHLNDDKQKFIRALYDAKLSHQDLHMVYACLVILGYCKRLAADWVDQTIEEPDKMRHELTLKIIGDIHELRIG